MKLFVRYPKELADLSLAGVSASARMNEAFCKASMQVHFLSEGEMPVTELLEGPCLWIEGLFPLLGEAILEEAWRQLNEKATLAIYAAGRPEVGILGLTDASQLKNTFNFEAWVKERKPAKLARDPFHLFPLRNPKDFYSLSQHFFQEKREDLMTNGVFLIEPATAWIETRVHIEPGVWIEPQVQIKGMSTISARTHIGQGAVIDNVAIGSDVHIKPHCVIEDSTIADRAAVGPFAHIRPGTQIGDDCKVGNFVETKKAVLGTGAKASHLTYLGDCTIGKDCNIGAGTITCNYDGFNKNKTILGDRVFVGSDSQLVAPVTLGDDSYVAAGSTITQDIPANALGISRGRQTNKPGLAQKLREKALRQKEEKR